MAASLLLKDENLQHAYGEVAAVRSMQDGRLDALGFQRRRLRIAGVALQQGLGRLIRHRQDRGVLAILDPRLRTMGYGRRIQASVPAAPVTHRLADIESFFAGNGPAAAAT